MRHIRNDTDFSGQLLNNAPGEMHGNTASVAGAAGANQVVDLPAKSIEAAGELLPDILQKLCLVI